MQRLQDGTAIFSVLLAASAAHIQDMMNGRALHPQSAITGFAG
jgi:hypothetical protein